MNYIEYRLKSCIKPVIVIAIVIAWFAGAYAFTHYIWVPSFEKPVNNRFDEFSMYSWSYDDRYEVGYAVYLLSQLMIGIILADYQDYRKLATSEDEK